MPSTYAIAVNPQQPDHFITLPQEPLQPGAHDLLVEVRAVAVNPVDTKVHASLRHKGLQQPRILGWDASGTVIAIGSAVSHFQVGDNVWYAGDLTRPGSNATQQLVDARICSRKPAMLDWAQAAALPLTALTAWEGLFEHLQIQQATAEKTLLIIGGAGGVGSLAIQLAALRSHVRVIATASRPESAAWCRARGAHLTVDYRHLQAELAQAGIAQVDYIFCLNDTDEHWPAICELIAPLGQICTIVENQRPLDQSVLKLKSAALHWEFMFTRSMFNTPDIARQGEILQQVAALADNGELHSTLNMTLHGLTPENLLAAHLQLLTGHTLGKVVITL